MTDDLAILVAVWCVGPAGVGILAFLEAAHAAGASVMWVWLLIGCAGLFIAFNRALVIADDRLNQEVAA